MGPRCAQRGLRAVLQGPARPTGSHPSAPRSMPPRGENPALPAVTGRHIGLCSPERFTPIRRAATAKLHNPAGQPRHRDPRRRQPWPGHLASIHRQTNVHATGLLALLP